MRGVKGRMWVLGLVVALALSVSVPVTAQSTRVKLRIAFPSVADMGDVPVLLAAERLLVQGIELEPIFFAQEPLMLQAVLRGEADLGAGASRAVLAAMQQGAGLKFFATQHRNLWTLYAKRELTRCEDLNGKRLAYHSPAGISTALIKGWFREKCPSANPNVLYIPGSENRAAALIANQIDITPLELADAVQVDQLRPGLYHRMADLSKDLPWLLESIYFTSPRTLASKREVLKTFVIELIKVHRLAARDPGVIGTVAPKYIKVQDTSLFSFIARAYVQANLWPTDGAFTAETVARTVKFFVDIESIKPGLKAEEIGDYTIVREVLEQIGK